MAELGSTSYPTEVNIRGYKPNKGVHVGQLKKAIALVEEAKKPMFLIGGGVNLAHAQEEMTELCEKLNIPVVTTVMGRGAIPTDHPLYIGNIGMHGSYAANKTADECDVMFSIGCRFNDRVTGNVAKFAPHAKIIHIDIEAAAISRNVTVDIPIVADAKMAIRKILDHTEPMDPQPVGGRDQELGSGASAGNRGQGRSEPAADHGDAQQSVCGQRYHLHLRRRTASDVGLPVSETGRYAPACAERWSRHDGIRSAIGSGRTDRMPGQGKSFRSAATADSR